MRRLFQTLAAACLLFAAAHAAAVQDRPRVVAVNFALQQLAEKLLGDAAEVVFPVPDGVDPSFWRPSIADISMVQSADVILLNGAGFATWIDRVSLPRSRTVNTSAGIEDQFIVTESITHSHGDGGEHSHEGLASYIWLDPVLAVAQAEAMATAFVARGLASSDDIEARLADLTSQLKELDAIAQAALAEVKDVALIATHPRYQYFARRYGLSVTALDWEAGVAPSSEQLNELEALVKKTGAGVLIWEAAPPQSAFDATSSLGLQNVVFEPLARQADAGSFIETFAEAVQAVLVAADNSRGN